MSGAFFQKFTKLRLFSNVLKIKISKISLKLRGCTTVFRFEIGIANPSRLKAPEFKTKE